MTVAREGEYILHLVSFHNFPILYPILLRMRLTCNQCMFDNIAVLGFFGIVLLIEGLIGTI
ncbi:MAG: hypothetical protein AUH89_02250 [Ktedonobacter sp. 13_1_40CM_4_52_4]|nr:MAG: hypothetical protein AUH89_02250 [Ktedonobacter sp. 13_1_40CM_4_52_4]